MRGVKNYTIKLDRNGDKVLKIGQETMNWYEKGMAIFRVAKVAASPTAWTNAVVGNLLMNHMSGGLDREFLKTLNLVRQAYMGKPGSSLALQKMMKEAGGDSDLIIKFLQENITATRGTFGSTNMIFSKALTEKMFLEGKANKILSADTKLEDVMNSTKDAMSEMNIFKKGIEDATRMKAGTSAVKKAFSESGDSVSSFDKTSGMMSQELFSSDVAAKMFEFIARKAKENPSNPGWKLANFTFNKMPSGYEQIDQVFKMATFIHATHNGYTLDQIKKLANIVKISPEEIALGKTAGKAVGQTGRNLYKLSPKTAMELANIQYLNYAAMPAAVRVIRNLPLLGSPFVSFMYGMMLKTGQTMAYNPSAFNKVTFAMNEFGGTKNPLEKKLIYDDTKNPAT